MSTRNEGGELKMTQTHSYLYKVQQHIIQDLANYSEIEKWGIT